MLSTPFISNPIRTNEKFTVGLVNLPIVIDNGKALKHYDDKKQKMTYDVIPNMRYPFFELDTLEEKKFERVMKQYNDFKMPVYVHRTMRGYHFICFVSLFKGEYAEFINPLMKLNPKCPMVTLRIKPNKWQGEKDIFMQSGIIPNGGTDMQISELEKVRDWINHQFIGLLQMHYYIVRYVMTGEQGNL